MPNAQPARHEFPLIAFLKHRMEAKNTLERARESAVLTSEILRARILTGFLVMITLGITLLQIVGKPFYTKELHSNFDVWPVGLISAAYIVYELGFILLLQMLKKRGLYLPAGPRYGNALLEISLPTLGLLVLHGVIPSDQVLELPPSLGYYVIVVLSILRQDGKLTLFTGLVGTLEYLALTFWWLPEMQAFPISQISRGAFILMTSLASVFVAVQIRKVNLEVISSQERQHQMGATLGQYVAPGLVERLLKGGGSLESELRPVCVLFLDIRGFTAYSQGKDPQAVTDYLNTLFSPLVAIVNQKGGLVNKFLGDGFMAVFGAPLATGDEAREALEASLEMIEAVEDLVARGEIPPTRIGIGLHTGTVMTGTIGTKDKREYTVIGDAVNVASRLESQCKEHKVRLVASNRLVEAARKSHPAHLGVSRLTSLGPLVLRGQDEALEAWGLE